LEAPGFERRRALAARIRLYLKQYGGIPLEERWYRILADDATTLEQWRQAASWIAMPTVYNDMMPRQWVESTVYFRRKGEKVALRGEALRQKVSPSVSQLLVRRMDDSLARLADNDWMLRLFGVRDFAVALSAWDGTSGLGELRHATASLEKLFASEETRATAKRPLLISMIIGIYGERFALNDPQAAADYAGWLRTLKPEDTDYEGAGLFNLASMYAGSPEIVEAVTHMFGDSSSPWSPVTGRLRYGTTDTLQFLKTGLLNFPAFRARVLEGLADRTVVGTLRPRATGPAGVYDLKVENLLAAAVAGATNVPDAVITFPDFDKRPPVTVNVRACDVYAWKLRGYEGAPWIELYWTEAERDAAVAASVKFLREHGGPFAYSETRAYRR